MDRRSRALQTSGPYASVTLPPPTSDAPAYKVPKLTLKVQIPFELMKTSSLFNTTNNVWYDFFFKIKLCARGWHVAMFAQDVSIAKKHSDIPAHTSLIWAECCRNEFCSLSCCVESLKNELDRKDNKE